jgi:hypothetical protein
MVVGVVVIDVVVLVAVVGVVVAGASEVVVQGVGLGGPAMSVAVLVAPVVAPVSVVASSAVVGDARIVSEVEGVAGRVVTFMAGPSVMAITCTRLNAHDSSSTS